MTPAQIRHLSMHETNVAFTNPEGLFRFPYVTIYGMNYPLLFKMKLAYSGKVGLLQFPGLKEHGLRVLDILIPIENVNAFNWYKGWLP